MRAEISFIHHDMRWIPSGNTDGTQEIAAWLDNDVVEQTTINWFIKQFNEFNFSVKKTNYIGSGNAHHVFSTGDYIFIMCEYVDYQKVLLPKEQCIRVLEKYRDFLSIDYKNKNIGPESFEVEYAGESEEALVNFIKLGGILKANP